MKKKIIFIGVIFSIFLVFVLIKSLIVDRPANSGRIRILTSPISGVILNDTPQGNTPYEVAYGPGLHRLKLIPQKQEGNFTPWEGQIEVFENALTYVIFELGSSDLTSSGEILTVKKMSKNNSSQLGALNVETKPVGAVVAFDSDEKGVSPISVYNIVPGTYELKISMPGFISRTQKIQIHKDRVVDAKIKLALDSDYKTIDQLIEEEKKEASQEALLENAKQEIAEASQIEQFVTIKNTESGFLNVRELPSINSKKIDEVLPNKKFKYLKKEGDWFQILLDDSSSGWVYKDYVISE